MTNACIHRYSAEGLEDDDKALRAAELAGQRSAMLEAARAEESDIQASFAGMNTNTALCTH